MIRLCGPLTVQIEGRRVEGALPSRQGRVVFAYLVLHRERPVARRELIDALWPGRAPASPEALLSTVLSRLRRALPPGLVEGRGDLMLQLGPDPWIDVEAARHAPADAASALHAGATSQALSVARSALAILARGLLPGLDGPWVEERRRALGDLEVGLLEVVARAGLAAGGSELLAAEAAARAAIEREPFRESAHTALMEALAARGNVAEALRAYDRVRTLLCDELGTVPSAELRVLSERLLRDEVGRTRDTTGALAETLEPRPVSANERRAPAAPGAVSALTTSARHATDVAGEVTLLGRDAECARIDGLLQGARRHRSGALVLCGDPGIGKSALCEWAVARAADMRPLLVHGVESQVDVPFAGLSELCAGELDRLDLLPAPQARALDGALARRDAPPGDRFAIGAALLSLLASASEREPLLVVVDDAQWLDGASADALLFAARRLRGEDIALLVATRPGSVFDAERAGLLHLTLGGLDPSAAHALLETAHGLLPAQVAQVLTDRSEGNPLALLEVPLALSETQLAGHQPIDEPLPVGPTLARALLHRVSGLPAEPRRALLVAAATGTERVQPVVDALAAFGLDRRVLEPAEQAGVLSVVGERFEFRHPLLRSAVYYGAPGPARREAHRALAQVTAGEPRAWHLAHATVGEDEGVAATLERVGLEARRRGAPAEAASALERAAGLSGPGEGRMRRLTEAARDAHIAGRPAGALRLLDDALVGSPDAVQRADIQLVRGRILVLEGEPDTAHRLLVDEAERVRDRDPERACAMLAEACLACVLGLEIRTTLTVARDAWAVAARVGSPAAQVYSACMLAVGLVLTGERAEAGALLDRFLPVLRGADPLTEGGQLVAVAAQCYFWIERPEVASGLLDGLITRARQASAPMALLLPLGCRAELDLRLGRWAPAAAHCQEAASLGEELSQPTYAAYALECLAWLAAATGDERRCRDHAAHASAVVEERHNDLGELCVHSALGLLELGLGRPLRAIQHLELARDLAEPRGLAEPNVVHWQANLIEAYARSGKPDAARNALASLERQAERTGGPWALGTAARCRGLLADDIHLEACFGTALEHLRRAAAPFEIARTHLCHGERLRRAGRRTDARRALRMAIEGFDQLGATPWAGRAHAELRASGVTAMRRRQDSDRDQLTDHELQVALIVARGASNREAAAALFLSPKTIEFHLAHVYRKLGVRTRTELAGIAGRRGWLDTAEPLSWS